MQILLRLCIFLIGLSYSHAQVITIKLTEIDASFVLDGTRLEDSKAIMLLVETDDNSMIMLNSWFGSQNETKFIVQDGITNYSSTALPPEAVFQQNLALDNLELNKNYQFWMIFRRLEGKNLTDPVLSTDHTIYYIPNAIEDYQVSVNKANKTQFFTFIHTLGSPSPQLYVWPYVAPNPNDCTITLYSGGIPSQVGAEKYDIFEFGATDPDERRFAKSLIAGFAATVEVPPNCEADIWAQTAGGWDVANELEMVATNEGFVMSQGYPFLATELSDKPSEIQAIYKVDDSEKYADQTTFHVELLHFDAGTPAGKLYLEIGTETQLILSSSTSQLSFSGHGPSFSVYFDTNDGSGNFLVRFTSYTEQEPSSNTTTLIPTEPTKKPATTERKTEATKDTTHVDVHSTDVTTSRGGTKSTGAPAESTPVSSGAPSGSSEPTKPTGIKTTTQSGSRMSLALCNFCLVLALFK